MDSDLNLHGLLDQSIQMLGDSVVIMKIATYLKEIIALRNYRTGLKKLNCTKFNVFVLCVFICIFTLIEKLLGMIKISSLIRVGRYIFSINHDHKILSANCQGLVSMEQIDV